MANDERQYRGRREGESRKTKPRETVNIEFARSLSSSHLCAILQLELIRARSQKPPATEVTLPTEIVHDIKFRLRYYERFHGEVDRKRFFNRDESSEDDEGSEL